MTALAVAQVRYNHCLQVVIYIRGIYVSSVRFFRLLFLSRCTALSYDVFARVFVASVYTNDKLSTAKIPRPTRYSNIDSTVHTQHCNSYSVPIVGIKSKLNRFPPVIRIRELGTCLLRRCFKGDVAYTQQRAKLIDSKIQARMHTCGAIRDRL